MRDGPGHGLCRAAWGCEEVTIGVANTAGRPLTLVTDGECPAGELNADRELEGKRLEVSGVALAGDALRS